MKKITYLAILALAGCSSAQSAENSAPQIEATKTAASGPIDTAILAGGCFWCMESDFEHLAGVVSAVSGYTGGDLQNPTYRNHGRHVEAAKITFDPAVISYDQILDYYWRHIDPTDDGGQFCDRGHAYIPVIYARPDQFVAAKASKIKLQQTKPFKAPIAVPVLQAKTFWDAEGYHQDYYKKNPRKYKYYRNGCGRDKRVEQLWAK